jgi:RHS repeat-associated protein
VYVGYDGDGNRVWKRLGTTTTWYLVEDRNPSGYAQVLEEWTNSSTATNLSRVYNYGLNLISQRAPGISTNYFIWDGHGSTRLLADAGGNTVNVFAYDAYGTLIASNGVPGTAYLYGGQQFDGDLGLYDNRARYLNVGTGRFWTSDSYEGNNEDPLSLHKYLYCKGNPVDGEDPDGHDDIGDVLGAIDIGFSLAAMTGPSISAQQAISVGSTCGPDVTVRLRQTLLDVDQTFTQMSKTALGRVTLKLAADWMYMHTFEFEESGWDIDKLVDLGVGGYPDFGNGSHLGTGITGADTVQFSFNGLHVYKGGSANYALFGKVMSLFYNSVYVGDSRFSEIAATTLARAHKGLSGHLSDYYGTEAVAFVKYGYAGTDPSDTAMSGLKTDPSNVASSDRFLWKWKMIHDTTQ